MKDLVFRKLKANEIEVRIGATTKKTFTLLLYKDARVDMNLLDEVVGAARWQRKHYMLGDDIYCSVGIYYDEIGWVWKDDVGSSGTIEVEKSKASDSFKRACVNATGVGRELYTAPEIKIWKKDENDDSFKYNHYFVRDIEYNGNEISKLVICNEDSGEVVFSYPKGTKVSKNADLVDRNENDRNAPITQNTKNNIQAIIGKLSGDKYENFKTWLSNQYGTTSIADLTEKQGLEVLKVFRK